MPSLGIVEASGDSDKLMQDLALINGGICRASDAGRLGCLFRGCSQGCSITNETSGVTVLSEGALFEQRNAGGWPEAALGLQSSGTLRKIGNGTAVFASVP